MKARNFIVLGWVTLTALLASCGGSPPVVGPCPSQPLAPPPKPGSNPELRGWVDLHAHPMSFLGFGGKAIPGGVDLTIPLPANARCRHQLPASTADEALGNDSAIHGAWSLTNPCGDTLRSALVPMWEQAQGTDSVVEQPGAAAGSPSYSGWPVWGDMLHQKMWIDWIRRAWQGGQRVMVALADHDDTTAHAFSGPGDGPNDDMGSADAQTDAMKALVAAHSDFMAIATGAEELRKIVADGKLAVVLGMEVDSIGNFNSDPAVMACDELPDACADSAKKKVSAEIQRLFDKGIRYLFPIHVVDNMFGGTAVYTGIFDLANEFTYGSAWELECAAPSEGIVYDGSFGMTSAAEAALRAYVLVKMFRGYDIPPPPKCAPGVGVRNVRGLSKLGAFAIHEMMRHGMFIDIDHMSQYAADSVLSLAEAVPGGYPVMSGHDAVRGRPPHARPSEMQHTPAQLQRVAKVHGMFGLGNAGIHAQEWIQEYSEATKLLPAAGAICFGTDLDGMVVGSPPSPGAHIEYPPNLPISSLGAHTWDYNDPKVGLAHYGMLPDFLADARNARGVNAADLIDNGVFASARYFQQTWALAEQRAASVPPEGGQAAVAQPSVAKACATDCCDACTRCATKGIAGGTCPACRGCQQACTCQAPPTVASSASNPPSTVDVNAAKAACDKGDAVQCDVAGKAYESGQGVTEDVAEAQRLFRSACALKRPGGCVHLGRMLDEGAGASPDDSQAAVFFRKACDLKDPEGCHRLAGLLAAGAGGPKNDREAAAFEGRACDAGFRHACLALAAMHKEGRSGTGAKAPAAATKVYQRMCARGDRLGCQQSQVPIP